MQQLNREAEAGLGPEPAASAATTTDEVGALASVLAHDAGRRSDPLALAHTLIDALPIPVFFKGRDGRYLGVNAAWETLFGVSRDAIVGKVVHTLYPRSPEVAKIHHAMDEELWARPGRQVYEVCITTLDGHRRHTIYHKATFTGPDGGVAGLIGAIVDITERKEAEQRLAVEHAVTALLAQSATIEQALSAVIQAVCEKLQWDCGARWSLDQRTGTYRCVETWSIPSLEIADFLEHARSREFAPQKAGLVRRVLATGEPFCIADVTREPGFLRGALAAKAGLRGALAFPILLGTRVLGAIEFYSREVRLPHDLLLQAARTIGNQIGQFMARKQAEQALEESEARFRSLTQLSSDWYWEQDEHYRFTAMSQGIEESLGVRVEEFLGKTRWDGPVVGLTQAAWEAHKAVLDARRPFYDLEYGRSDAEGHVRYLSVSGQPVFDGEGRFIGYRGVGKDITERKRAETALREAHDALARKAQELARSNAELEQFAYVASHDLQEPLRMVASYTQLLAKRYGDRLDGDAKEFMEFIVDGATRMKQLIEDLLAFSRVGTRGKEFRRVECETALQRALANLQLAIDQSGAVVTHDPLPAVSGDDSQLVQLFQNLIGNALKFSGTEAPRIHVGVEQRPDEWVFAVRDNGIGIDRQYFERIFIVFQRLHAKSDYPGTGIGLAICKKVVERHGGRIWVESEPGKGSVFYFSLPKGGANVGG